MRKKIQATERASEEPRSGSQQRVYSSVDELVKEIGGEVECHYARLRSENEGTPTGKLNDAGGKP